MNEQKFTWVPFYRELANKLLQYKNRRIELIEIIKSVYSKADEKLSNIFRDTEVQTDIDPFTLFAGFNFGKQGDTKRKRICQCYRDALGITVPVPEDYESIPVQRQDQKIIYGQNSDSLCFSVLWELFERALTYQPNQSDASEFTEAYTDALRLNQKKDGEINGHQQNRLTKSLFYIRPDLFISLDETNRTLLIDLKEDARLSEHAHYVINIVTGNKVITGDDYLQFCLEMRSYLQETGQGSLLDFSYRAFQKSQNAKQKQKDEVNDDTDVQWFPSLTEYNPRLTADNWRQLLQDPSVFDADSLDTIKAFYEIGGQAALIELEAINGKSKNYNKSVCERLAQRVIAKTNCPSVPEEINQGAKTWPVLFYGRHAKSGENGRYIWRLREELMQALATISSTGYKNPYSQTLIESKNIIFRGAPGTGKSYLAKGIAADIISNGTKFSYDELTSEQKLQVEFVQFHPSYDYTDFVEGLRPVINSDRSMGFKLMDGVFKAFVDRAKKNFENSQKSQEAIEKEQSAQEALSAFLASTEFEKEYFETLSGNKFTITGVDEQHIYIFIPENPIVKNLCLNIAEILQMLESDKEFDKIKDISDFFGKQYATQGYSYDFILYKKIKAQKSATQSPVKPEELKKYVFIIDEINRGEISKIFGELFFAIDPGYRGKAGEISTQYANLHDNPNEKFYIPDNVYIIGTMNDIDRSVDSFDFAMRRRFRFIEIKADVNISMLDKLGDKSDEAKERLKKLNRAIVKNGELNENYQIGAAYFLKLDHLSFDELWTDYLQPLLLDYVQGVPNYQKHMDDFAEAYGYKKPEKEQDDEASQD